MFIMLWRALAHPLRQHVQCVSHVPDVYVVHFRYVTRQTEWSQGIKTDCCGEERMMMMILLLMGEHAYTHTHTTNKHGFI